MIQNITTPLSSNTPKEILEQIKEETEKGLMLQLIRKYQVEYGNGSWSENVLVPYKKNKNLIIINHPEDAERLANNYINKIGNLKPFVLDSIISTTDESHWREQRRDFQPAFSVPGKIEKVIPVSCERANNCVKTLWSLSDNGKKEVDINEFLLNETHAQLQLAMFGFSKNFEKNNNKEIREMFSNYNPKTVNTTVNKLMDEIKNSNGPISKVINERQPKATQRENVGNGLIFSYAGHDTTGNTLTFLIYELCKKPEFQYKLREEVNNFWICQGESNITYKDFKRLPFMTRCIMETLRLWPALANGTFRVLDEDDTIKGRIGEDVKIPKGTFVQIPNWFRHRNPELWGEDVNEFNPERKFKDEELWEGSVINTYNPSTERFSPFTYGPRDCIGKNFSQMEMRVILLHLLQSYLFELTPEQEEVNENKFIFNKFTMGPRNIKNITDKDNNFGLFVKVKRLSLHSKL
jgi:cytochrome P450